MSSSSAFAPEWCGGTDAWSREARRILDIAKARRLDLDRETLTLSDVRDLQALRLRLEGPAQSASMRAATRMTLWG